MWFPVSLLLVGNPCWCLPLMLCPRLVSSQDPGVNWLTLYNSIPWLSSNTESILSSIYVDFDTVSAVKGSSSLCCSARVWDWGWKGDELIPNTTRLNSYSSGFLCWSVCRQTFIPIFPLLIHKQPQSVPKVPWHLTQQGLCKICEECCIICLFNISTNIFRRIFCYISFKRA